jgi:mandelate racemase
VLLMVDFNQGLTLGDALRRCHALDDQGLYWFEEPIAYNNLSGYAELARQLSTPVQLGENFYGPRALFDAITSGAGDYVMPDLMRIGGVSGWLHAAPIASAAGIQVSTHLYPEVAAHLMRVTETAHWLEWQDWANPVLKQPFELKNGCLEIPDRPGIGIEWDERAVERYQA